jgi:peroxiredoxin
MRKVSIAVFLTCSLLTAAAQTQKEPAPPMPNITIGDLAPDFTLVDQNGQPHSLHDYRGKKNVALTFYVLFDSIPTDLRAKVDAEVSSLLARFQSGSVLSVPVNVIVAGEQRHE